VTRTAPRRRSGPARRRQGTPDHKASLGDDERRSLWPLD